MPNWDLRPHCVGYLLFFEVTFYLHSYPSSRLHNYPFFKSLGAPLVELPQLGSAFPVLLEQILRETESSFIPNPC